MPITDLIPWKRREPVPPEQQHAIQVEEQPLATVQQQMNRLFDSFFGESGLQPFGLFREGWGVFSPQVDALESDSEITVSVELAGMDEQDIDVTLSRDMLTISGEKRQEEEKGRNFFHSERSYGSFKRSVPLPCEVDAAKADAVFRKGVLSITLPKIAKSQASRRIGIRTR